MFGARPNKLTVFLNLPVFDKKLLYKSFLHTLFNFCNSFSALTVCKSRKQSTAAKSIMNSDINKRVVIIVSCSSKTVLLLMAIM